MAPCVCEGGEDLLLFLYVHAFCMLHTRISMLLAKDIGSRLEKNGVLTRVTSHGPVFIFDPVIAACDSDIRRLPIFAPALQNSMVRAASRIGTGTMTQEVCIFFA